MKGIHVDFPHGLGDCVYFAHQMAVYREQGYDVKVHCAEDKAFIFQPLQNAVPLSSGLRLSWKHGEPLEHLDDTNHWLANKAFANFSLSPLPSLDTPLETLWQQFSGVHLDLKAHLQEGVTKEVADYLGTLPHPIILLHTKGNSFQSAKSVPDPLAIEIYREILDHTGGTLLLLDWDNRVPKIAHGRIRHLLDDWKRLNVEELFATICQADLVVGIDSGPLHLCQFTDTPAVGLWFNGHHPAKYSLPREQQVNITLKKHAVNGNKYTRWFYNIVEEQGEQISASTVGRVCRQMLQPPRYLQEAQRGKDVILQHWIDDWTAGGISNYMTFIDRDKSFDLMLRHLKNQSSPRLVETGCIRQEEDWRGAGFGTYLLGAYSAARLGKLDSVDTSNSNCDFARKWTRVFGCAIKIHCNDSLSYLHERSEPIDLLYLDSWDTYVPGFAEHGLREIQVAERLLHENSMVVYDDTSILAGRWQGKGMLGVPWLLDKGWRTVYVGHQTLLIR
jgi:hypothetical protein